MNFVLSIKWAKEDQFGRDIKLSNGNVASRILPIKIHDLDAQDNALFGNELGGALRSIEFIFKSPGVNRPLRPDDRREDNLNRLSYRDQVNKVANALKEITSAMRFPDKPLHQNSYSSAEADTTTSVEKSVVEVNENSIAVLPFVSLGSGFFARIFCGWHHRKYSDSTGQPSQPSGDFQNLDHAV
jgi:hypothetical protein